MEKQSFTISEALQEGWRLTKENIGFLLIYQIIFKLILLIGDMLGKGTWNWVSQIMFGLLLFISIKGLYQFSLLIASGIKPNFGQLKKILSLFPSWLLASILYGIAITIGFSLLIIPGLYILVRCGLYPFFILERECGPLMSLSLSWEATRGMHKPLILLFLILVGIDYIGSLSFFYGMGILIIRPFNLLVLAVVYRKITAKNEQVVYSSDIVEPVKMN